MKFNNVEITQETIELTRKRFADNAMACIEEVKNGTVKVNDPESYFEWRMSHYHEALAGNYDHTFAFMQMAYYIQTGKEIPFL